MVLENGWKPRLQTEGKVCLAVYLTLNSEVKIEILKMRHTQAKGVCCDFFFFQQQIKTFAVLQRWAQSISIQCGMAQIVLPKQTEAVQNFTPGREATANMLIICGTGTTVYS